MLKLSNRKQIKSNSMTVLLLVSISLFICSCSEVKKDNQDFSIKSSKDTLLNFDGIWAENDSDNALFVIRGDTLRNVEHERKVAFKIIGDTMIPSYYDIHAKSIILKHTKDSLVLKHEDNYIERLYNRGVYK